MNLCDIGNSTFHFYLNDKEFKLSTNEPIELPCLDDTIYYISVNKKATQEFLKIFKNAINIEDFMQFDTKYDGMGIDRKVACFEAKDAIIVDVGSAITVDVMQNGSHVGGYILPGIDSYVDCYKNISEVLTLKNNMQTNIDIENIPQNTNDAIQYAIINSIVLPIKNTKSKYNMKIYFTGDNFRYIRNYFEDEIYEKNLIFNNLKRIIHDNHSTT